MGLATPWFTTSIEHTNCKRTLKMSPEDGPRCLRLTRCTSKTAFKVSRLSMSVDGKWLELL